MRFSDAEREPANEINHKPLEGNSADSNRERQTFFNEETVIIRL